MEVEVKDYITRVREEEAEKKANAPRKVSKSNLQWQPRHYPLGKFDFNTVRERLIAKIEAGDKIAVTTIKKNIKRVVRDNPHYEEFAQLLDL